MKAKKLYEAFGYIDDWYLDVVDAPQKETTEMKKETRHISARRTLTLILAAALCISILAVTAMAAGWIPGLFNALKEKYPQDEELFEAAAQANSASVPEIFVIPQLDLSQFVLLEQFFDGETILIGYNLDIILPEPTVGVEPNSDLMEKIKNGYPITSTAWSEQQSWQIQPVTDNAIKYELAADASEMDSMLKGTLSEDAYQKVWDHMENQGYVCIAVRDAWLGDHILINGVDTIEAFMESNAYADRTEYTSDIGNCIRLESLPEDVRNKDRITITLNVRSSVNYWYMDLDGNGRIYYDDSSILSDQISFELNRVE